MTTASCGCCGRIPCMFDGTSTVTKLREIHRRVQKMPNDDGKDVRDLALLLKLREGGPSFSSGSHEERRAFALSDQGLTTSKETVFRTGYNRQGAETVEFRKKWSITDAGLAHLKAAEARASSPSRMSRPQKAK